MSDTDAILALAAIIREVDGNHSLGAVALAEAILSHPGSRWGRPAPAPAGKVAELVARLRDRQTVPLLEERDRAAALLERQTAPVPAGEAAKPAADIRHFLSGYRQMRGLDPEHIYSIHRGDAMEAHITVSGLTRIADLLEQRQAAPVPVASDTRYEFSVFDEDYTEQAGGSAPTYAQALSEGEHYLAQYQQDGPHTLEVRRVENLNPDAFPVPDDAPVPLLPEGAQVIEPTKHTILVPALAPVAVSLRPWEREGWCDEQGRCWWFNPEDPHWVFDDATCRHWAAFSLPHNALPLPGGEVQP